MTSRNSGATLTSRQPSSMPPKRGWWLAVESVAPFFQAAGLRSLQQACDEVAPCPVEESRLTPAFALESQGVSAVIHSVGPDFRWTSLEETDVLLGSAYKSAVRCAIDASHASLPFPSLSTGIFQFPVDRAARLSVEALRSLTNQISPSRWLRSTVSRPNFGSRPSTTSPEGLPSGCRCPCARRGTDKNQRFTETGLRPRTRPSHRQRHPDARQRRGCPTT